MLPQLSTIQQRVSVHALAWHNLQGYALLHVQTACDIHWQLSYPLTSHIVKAQVNMKTKLYAFKTACLALPELAEELLADEEDEV